MIKGLSTNMNQLCDQMRNMNFNKSGYFVNNKGKEVLMKKNIYKKGFRGLQDLRIDKFFMSKEGRTTNMSDKISPHIS